MPTCLSHGKYPSEIIVGFRCHYHPFLPSAFSQTPLYPGDALWIQMLVDRENANSQNEKTPVMGVGDETVSGNSRERARLFLNQGVSLFRSRIGTRNKQGQIRRKIIPLCLVVCFLLGSGLHCIGSPDSC